MIWVIAHDAGGAEILSSWILREKKAGLVTCVLEGPAEKIFARKIQTPFRQNSFAEFKAESKKSDHVVTGSGVASDLEFNAINFARQNGIPVSTWIDHWINYPNRFTRHGTRILPDEIWVSDLHQREKVYSELGSIPSVLKTNPYFEDIVDQWKAMPIRQSADRLSYHWLFIGEAWSEIRPDAIKLPLSQRPELVSFQRFLKMASESSFPNPTVRIRPHPAEKPEKYLQALRGFQQKWEWSPAGTLIEDCAWADEVVGMGSMGLVIAALGGKPTTSISPNSSWVCPLPFDEIRKI